MGAEVLTVCVSIRMLYVVPRKTSQRWKDGAFRLNTNIPTDLSGRMTAAIDRANRGSTGAQWTRTDLVIFALERVVRGRAGLPRLSKPGAEASVPLPEGRAPVAEWVKP